VHSANQQQVTPAERLQEVARREAAADAQAIVATVVRRIGRLQPPGPAATFLDVGCAAGATTAAFADAGFKVTGVDLVPEFVSLARKSHPDIPFVVSAAEDLPFQDESFDYVVLLSVLEHVRDWRDTLAEAVRVLKRGGVLYVNTTNRFCPKQHEIRYIWGFGYLPDAVRRAIYSLAMTYKPSLVHHTAFPAYHWFSHRQLSRELRRHHTQPYHWLALMRDDDVPARYRRPLLFSLVRFALRHPATTYLISSSTTILARKETSSDMPASEALGDS
jgi:ubiquinone/menaquinone biosynthesis C-methylase UbiE